MVIPNLLNSENGRILRDGNIFPSQNTTLFKTAGLRFIMAKTRFPVVNTKKSLVFDNKIALIFTSENDNLCAVCQTFCLLKQVQQAFQTCHNCRFQDFVVNQPHPMRQNYQKVTWLPQGGHSAHAYTGGSVREIFSQARNISSASPQPKTIG